MGFESGIYQEKTIRRGEDIEIGSIVGEAIEVVLVGIDKLVDRQNPGVLELSKSIMRSQLEGGLPKQRDSGLVLQFVRYLCRWLTGKKIIFLYLFRPKVAAAQMGIPLG